MSQELRWRLEEVKVRYELEPQLRDFYFEGSLDIDLFSHAVSRNEVFRGACFYQIDSVDVPIEVLKKHELTSGNKQRLVALARELESIGAPIRARCIVDSDLDRWMGSCGVCSNLHHLSVCSVECFFFRLDIAERILKTAAKSRISEFSRFFASIGKVLNAVYSFRLADRELELKLRWLDLGKYLSKVGSEVLFDARRYLEALLRKV